MNKKSILTVIGFVGALALGAFASLAYVDGAQERDRDTLQRVLSEQFAVFDKDANGFMSMAELEVFARNTYRSIVMGDETPEQQDRNEFIVLFKKNANSGQDTASLEHEAQTLFDNADMNGDEILSDAEYVAFYMHGLSRMGWQDFDTKGIALITGPRAPAGE